MFDDVDGFLGWYGGVHRRTLRDVAALPPDAETWNPPRPIGDDGASWTIGELVVHLVEARSYFASAFLGRGWVWPTAPRSLCARNAWTDALESSFAEVERALHAPGADPRARVPQIGEPSRAVSGWRVLMMLAEHEIAHRAQIAAYAGLNGWPIPQLFGRDNEWVRAQADGEHARAGRADP
jgi:uncharacterized damage-inducible protein DinB